MLPILRMIPIEIHCTHTCMSSLVYFEIFRASKHFATAYERTRKGLLARMHAYMIDQLVFGLERFELARTILPVACVHGLIGRRRRQ